MLGKVVMVGKYLKILLINGGRVWKLFDKAGKRIASLGADGSVLSK